MYWENDHHLPTKFGFYKCKKYFLKCKFLSEEIQANRGSRNLSKYEQRHIEFRLGWRILGSCLPK